MKACPSCKVEKRESDFYDQHAYCKPCHYERTLVWRNANREKVRGYQRSWEERNPDAKRQRRLARYGLTPEAFDELLAAQGGRCAICKSPTPGGRNWHIDHDHSCCSGEGSCGKCVRGILCWPCNAGLGQFKDNPVFLEDAIKYLRADLG